MSADLDSQKRATDFIRLLHDKKTKDAYQLFTNKLKQKFADVAAFDDYLAKHPSQWIVVVPTQANKETNDPKVRVFTYTNLDRGKLTIFLITMAKVDSTWMVDDLDIVSV